MEKLEIEANTVELVPDTDYVIETTEKGWNVRLMRNMDFEAGEYYKVTLDSVTVLDTPSLSILIELETHGDYGNGWGDSSDEEDEEEESDDQHQGQAVPMWVRFTVEEDDSMAAGGVLIEIK